MLSRITAVQVCDARDDDSSNAADKKNVIQIRKKLLFKKELFTLADYFSILRLPFKFKPAMTP